MLDLKSPHGLEVARRRVATADVVIENLGDSPASLHGVIGALMSLLRVRTGPGDGQVVDVSLFESVFNVMESVVPEYDMMGFVRERAGGALPGIRPSNTYPTADGRYVVIAGNGDPIFRRLMTTIGRGDLGTDPGLQGNSGHVVRSDELDSASAAWTRARPIAEMLAVLETAEIPAGAIYSVADIVADPHYQASGMILPTTLPDGTEVRMPGITPMLSDKPGDVRWAAQV